MLNVSSHLSRKQFEILNTICWYIWQDNVNCSCEKQNLLHVRCQDQYERPLDEKVLLTIVRTWAVIALNVIFVESQQSFNGTAISRQLVIGDFDVDSRMLLSLKISNARRALELRGHRPAATETISYLSFSSVKC